MDWLLIMYFKNEFYDQYDIEIIFTKAIDNENIYKVFRMNDYDSIDEYERCILETLNLYVSLRDNVYLSCNINGGCYNFICKNMLNLRKRIKKVIDLDSLNEITEMFSKNVIKIKN